MFQPFIVFCALNMDPTFDNCIINTQSAYYESEKECMLQLEGYTKSLEFLMFLENYYVYSIDCNDFLKKEVKAPKL